MTNQFDPKALNSNDSQNTQLDLFNIFVKNLASVFSLFFFKLFKYCFILGCE
jgi:hypothetical protein